MKAGLRRITGPLARARRGYVHLRTSAQRGNAELRVLLHRDVSSFGPVSHLLAAVARARLVFGIGSALVVVSFLLSQSVVSVVLDVLSTSGGPLAEMAWIALLGAAALWLFHRWDAALTRSLTAPITDAPTVGLSRRRGLIVLCGLNSGRPDSPVARLLADATSVEYLVLLGTPQTRERRVGEQIRDMLAPAAGRSLSRENVRILTDASAQSVTEFAQVTREALAWLESHGVPAADVIIDVTEGRRAMGYGALVAAEAHQVETQYLARVWDPSGSHELNHLEWTTVHKVPTLS